MDGGSIEASSVQDTLEALKKEFSKWAKKEAIKDAIDIFVGICYFCGGVVPVHLV